MTWSTLVLFVFIIYVLINILSLFMNPKNDETAKIEILEEQIPSKIPFEIPFEYRIVPGKEAEKVCLKIREEGKVTPVIYAGYSTVRRLFDYTSNSTENPESIIKKSKEFDISKFTKTRIEEISNYYSYPELIGKWPSKKGEKHRLSAPNHVLSKRPIEKVFIGLIPTLKAYEVPAYLNYGCWNECPNPEDHVGILKYWFDKYGAEIISVAGDVVETTVKKPPRTREEALILAREQFAYCPDIVVQGVGTISDLASTLIDSEYWYFWWD